MKKWIPVILSALIVAVMCCFIFYMSAQPADDSTVLSHGAVEDLVRLFNPGYDQLSSEEQLAIQEEFDHPIRKLAHFMEYTALGFLIANLVFQIARVRGRFAFITTTQFTATTARHAATTARHAATTAQHSKNDEKVAGFSTHHSNAQQSNDDEGVAAFTTRHSSFTKNTSFAPKHATTDKSAASFITLPKLGAISWTCATLYAASDEIHQLFVPGRAGMITDVCLDSSGVLLGVVIFYGIIGLVRRRVSKP